MPRASPWAADGTNSLQDIERLKREAARRALDLVRPGMRLGLGTGSTARHFVDLLGERVAQGLAIVGVPTSEKTRAQAESLGVPVTTLDEAPELDLAVDGADEIDPALRLIKGGGGALLREKIVAAAAGRMIVIADDSKLVDRLGRFALPVEVVPFGREATRRHIARAAAGCGCRGDIRLRLDASGGAPFITDGGHNIFDCAFGAIGDPPVLAAALQAIPGVVDHGLFIGLARGAILAGAQGIRLLGDLA
ncbi:MAG TPA: ribose-5-phosphate isomerase RpiA [Roseiarcus sp.]|jgi:ribose 5-phosphate isomerase A|nr:ribose-5-phosphate isomerase RpiA [Roseiarcus sp.]